MCDTPDFYPISNTPGARKGARLIETDSPFTYRALRLSDEVDLVLLRALTQNTLVALLDLFFA